MGWAEDFSYSYFCKLLEHARTHFDVRPIAEAPEALASHKRPLMFFRHDVDVDLEPAAVMAELEANAGVRSTYMILPGSSLYSLGDASSRGFLRRILAGGCEAGLHFDCPDELRSGNPSVEDLASAIDEACRPIEDVTGLPVRSLSFHRPIPSLLRGPLEVGGRVNAYGAPLMKRYLSDSKGDWREGEPLPKLMPAAGEVFQVLTHPIWWGTAHMAAPDRLQHMFEEKTRTASPSEATSLSRAIAETLPGIARRNAPVANG
jgi:hypothetical protein